MGDYTRLNKKIFDLGGNQTHDSGFDQSLLYRLMNECRWEQMVGGNGGDCGNDCQADVNKQTICFLSAKQVKCERLLHYIRKKFEEGSSQVLFY